MKRTKSSMPPKPAVSIPKQLSCKTVDTNQPAKHPLMGYLDGYPMLFSTTLQLLSWDTMLCIRFNRFANYQGVALFFKWVSRLGDGWFWGGMLVLTWLMQSPFESVSLVGLTGLLSASLPIITTMVVSVLGMVLYKILKVKTIRPRPYQVHQVIILGERPLDVFSFPSGHTLQAVLLTLALMNYAPILLWLMLPFTLLVAVSRVILGLHYPTDVLMGALLGFVLAQMIPLVYDVLQAILIT